MVQATALQVKLVEFDNRPLSEVFSEFNRYNQRQLVVEDRPGVARQVAALIQWHDLN